MKIKKSAGKKIAPGGVNKDPMLRVKVDLDAPKKKKKKVVDEEPVKKKKKKKVVEDDEPVKKKKKKKLETTEVAVYVEPERKKISKLKNVKKMRSIVGDSAEEISQLLEGGETDTAVSMMYKRMLQMLMDLLPHAEQYVRKTKASKGVYQVNALISNVRELMVDIQAAQDRGRIAEDLDQRILQPAFREMATQFIRDYDALDTDLRRIFKVSIELNRPATTTDLREAKEIIVSARNRLAAAMQAQYKEIQTGLINSLQR